MKTLLNAIFVVIITLNIIRYVVGWKVPSHSCSSTNGLDTSYLDEDTPAVKLYFRNVQLVLMATHQNIDVFGKDQLCTSRVISENGTFIGIRMLHPYYEMSYLYSESRRVSVKNAKGLDMSFNTNYLPKADITSSLNDVNVTVTDNLLSQPLSVLVYQFRRGTCKSYEYRCSNNGMCLNYKLINNDMYDFCNSEGVTTTQRPLGSNNDYGNGSSSSSTSSSSFLSVLLIILFMILLVGGGVCCFCYCCNDDVNNDDGVQRQNRGEGCATTRNTMNAISNPEIMPTSPSYTEAHVSMVEPTTSPALPNVTDAPPDYNTLKFDSIEMPPSYEDIISKTMD